MKMSISKVEKIVAGGKMVLREGGVKNEVKMSKMMVFWGFGRLGHILTTSREFGGELTVNCTTV